MKNYWLKRRDNNILAKDKNARASLYYGWANQVVDHLSKYDWMARFERDDIIQELVFLAFEKEQKFDHKKGNALCFFSTVMSGWCHCNCRSPQSTTNMQKFKGKFQEAAPYSHPGRIYPRNRQILQDNIKYLRQRVSKRELIAHIRTTQARQMRKPGDCGCTKKEDS